MTAGSYGRYKKRELVHYGIDYLKASITQKSDLFKPKLLKLGLSENSPLFFISDNVYIEYVGSRDRFDSYFNIKDKETGLTLAFVLLVGFGGIKKKGSVTLTSIFEITGVGLIFNDLKFYFDLLNKLGYKIDKFKRVDLCFDLKEDINYIYKNVLKDKLIEKTNTPFFNKGVLETLYIGQKQNSKNTYQLIRIYNKILDSKAKGKLHLYEQYKTKKGRENITRFEVELRRDRAKFLTQDKLLDDEYIFSVLAKTFYGFNIQYFKFIKYGDFEKIKTKNESLRIQRNINIQKREKSLIKYGKDFFDEIDEQRTLKTFINLGKRLKKNGYTREKMLEILENNEIIEVSRLKK